MTNVQELRVKISAPYCDLFKWPGLTDDKNRKLMDAKAIEMHDCQICDSKFGTMY